MVQRKPPPAPAKKRVWRITEAAPLGEFVDVNAAPTTGKIALPQKPAAALPEATEATVSSGGWVVSSFELLSGADVTEGYDTVPGDLFDAFFEPPAPPPAKKPPGSG
ncbi:MAG TPA: hypothetical protein VNU71_00455 [Burkholderiaceae bacterium]|nr:hypothetical protein [Burkholderiaceae bacterium]